MFLVDHCLPDISGDGLDAVVSVKDKVDITQGSSHCSLVTAMLT